MKVLIVCHYFPPHIGGIEVIAQSQAKHLAKHGHDVSVLTSAIGAPKGMKTHKDNYKVFRTPAFNYFENKHGVPFPVYSLGLIKRSYSLVKASDVVHIHDALYLSSIVTAFLAWLLHRPVILTQHVAIVPHPKKIVGLLQSILYRTSGQFIFSHSRKIIVYNGRVKAFLVNRGINDDKIVSITNGTDFDLFYPVNPDLQRKIRIKYDLPTDKTLALFVGRFVPKKGFNKLLEIQSNSYIIVFAGGIAPQKYAIDSHYKFLGSLSQRELADIYRACDIFILPSEGEGFPLSIQEAMASGLPIITTDDEGYSILDFDRELMRLIQPTVEEIRLQLDRLASNKQLRKNMGHYSLSYAKNYFNWEHSINKLMSVYQESLS